MKYGTKKVNRLFIDNKVPKEKREEIPLILDNDNNILWVYDNAKSYTLLDDKENGDIYLVCEEINNE